MMFGRVVGPVTLLLVVQRCQLVTGGGSYIIT